MGSRKTFITAAAVAAAFAGLPTAASAAPSDGTKPSEGLVRAYDKAYERVVDAGGEPGRNIAEDGMRKDGDERAATRTEVKTSLSTLRTMHLSLQGTPTSTGTGSSTQAGASAPAGTSAGNGLDAVAQCESGGDPGAVSPDGQYRGKYQFDQQTWNSVGGSGDPAAAPEAEQDQRAAQLQAQRGSSPWPVCG
jgi:hypothetical protein